MDVRSVGRLMAKLGLDANPPEGAGSRRAETDDGSSVRGWQTEQAFTAS